MINKTEIDSNNQNFHLKLFIFGDTLSSIKAKNRIGLVFQDIPEDSYELDIIDLNVNPEYAADYKILAMPCLIRLSPMPVIRIIGDLSDVEKVRELIF